MTAINDMLDDLFAAKSSVFLESGEEAFSVNFVPKLRFRDEQLKELAFYYKSIITLPTSTRTVIIQGNTGTGKSTVSRFFGEKLEAYINDTIKKGFLFKVFYINVRNLRSPYSIMAFLIRQLSPSWSIRGYSLGELLHIFKVLLSGKRLIPLLILDEVDFLWRNSQDGNDFLYSLIRFHEEELAFKYEQPIGLNLLLITRDPNFRDYLDDSNQSSLERNLIYFPPYTKEQLFQIVKDRAEVGLKEGSYDETILEQVATLAAPKGDARLAIEMLWRGAKVADREGSNKILPDYIREAKASVFPVERSIINTLHSHQKLLLIGILKYFQKEKEKTEVPTPTIRRKYLEVCEEKEMAPRGTTQIWEYIKDLQRIGLINCEVTNLHVTKGRNRGKSKGRVGMVSIPDIPVNTLLAELEKQVTLELEGIKTTKDNK